MLNILLSPDCSISKKDIVKLAKVEQRGQNDQGVGATFLQEKAESPGTLGFRQMLEKCPEITIVLR